jgi:hypothetical protein
VTPIPLVLLSLPEVTLLTKQDQRQLDDGKQQANLIVELRKLHPGTAMR